MRAHGCSFQGRRITRSSSCDGDQFQAGGSKTERFRGTVARRVARQPANQRGPLASLHRSPIMQAPFSKNRQRRSCTRQLWSAIQLHSGRRSTCRLPSSVTARQGGTLGFSPRETHARTCNRTGHRVSARREEHGLVLRRPCPNGPQLFPVDRRDSASVPVVRVPPVPSSRSPPWRCAGG